MKEESKLIEKQDSYLERFCKVSGSIYKDLLLKFYDYDAPGQASEYLCSWIKDVGERVLKAFRFIAESGTVYYQLV